MGKTEQLHTYGIKCSVCLSFDYLSASNMHRSAVTHSGWTQKVCATGQHAYNACSLPSGYSSQCPALIHGVSSGHLQGAVKAACESLALT